MALTIEDGSIVSGAESYATVAELDAYCTNHGLTLSGSDAAKEALLRRAVQYLEDQNWKGARVSAGQVLSWPRAGVYVHGLPDELDSDAVPAPIVAAQCQLAYDQAQADLLPSGAGRETLSETVGPISVSYAASGAAALLPTPTRALALLRPYLRGGFSLSVARG